MGLFDFIEDEGARTKAEEAHNTALKDTIDAAVGTKVEEAITGLKNKNAELLDEKKRIAETLKNFDDLDPEKAREALKFLEENENARLLKEGKIDELLAKQTSSLKEGYENTIGELSKKLESSESSGLNYKNQYENKMVEDALRQVAILSGVRKEALGDVIIHGSREFSLNTEDGSIEARDAKGVLKKTKDDLVLTPEHFVEGLKTTHPHYWPDSEGAGALGGGDGGELSDMMDAMNAAAKKGDMVKYRAIRAKYNKKKSKV